MVVRIVHTRRFLTDQSGRQPLTLYLPRGIMFRSRTLFVVGAGASHEVGLPTGAALKTSIARTLEIDHADDSNCPSGDDEIASALRRRASSRKGIEGNLDPYVHACRSISKAMPLALSIDEYMDCHKNDEEIQLCGKLAIARCILESERSSRLSPTHTHATIPFSDIEATWYNLFFQVLKDGYRKSERHNVFSRISFITFNYDRCIEYFIVHALQNWYDIPCAEASELADTLTIVHPYGTVGRLPWQTGTSVAVPFGCSDVDLLEVTRQIRTFTERIEDPLSLEIMRKQVNKARVLVFLGFAFHPMNMTLITPEHRSSNKQAFATAYGISYRDCDVIEEQIKQIIGDSHHGLEVCKDATCSDLFNNFRKTLSVA